MAKAIDTRRHRAALPVFTPSAVSAESLTRRTVGREAEIERLVRAIRTAATTVNRPHQLIVGPRGSGKSHLLIVALHEAVSDDQITDRVAVAMLPEDAVEIAGYEDLLVSIIERTAGTRGPPHREARDLRVRRDVAGLERLMLQQLRELVLVLVVENLDRVFHDLGDIGQARLRNLTETSAKVLLLASTPLLFDAVSDHARPWYGSFDVEHLRELNAEQGRDLLQHVAVSAGDEKLAALLSTATGLSRVKAVEHLAGGSPRMWTVLAGCMTVDLLDELVPLVEALFDELAPYYQQRLWELAGAERKLVYELCRMPSGTVKDLAHATGLSQRAAATSLGRLHDASWVRREKRAGSDRRKTWYALREPLLRHHVEYRDAHGDTLPAIVGFLRAWFEIGELLSRLVMLNPGSPAQRYVLAAISGAEDAVRFGAWPWVGRPFAESDPGCDLLAMARTWLATSHSRGIASSAAAVVVEAVGLALTEGPSAAQRAAAARLKSFDVRRVEPIVGAVDAALAAMSPGPVGACGRGLLAASGAGELDDRDGVALGLLAETDFWGPGLSSAWFEAHEAAVDRLPPEDERLGLIFQAKRALGMEVPTDALARLTEVLRACAETLGPRDWTTRSLVYESMPHAIGAADCEAHEVFAATVVDVMTRAQLVPELSGIIVFSSLEAIAVEIVGGSLGPTDRDPRHGWFPVWARATSASADLGPIHRLLRAQTESGDLARMATEDIAYLLPMITGHSDSLKGFAKELMLDAHARASAASAGSSSGGPSRGS